MGEGEGDGEEEQVTSEGIQGCTSYIHVLIS